jgi:hypothetical protein
VFFSSTSTMHNCFTSLFRREGWAN